MKFHVKMKNMSNKLTKCAPTLGILISNFKPNLVQKFATTKGPIALALLILVHGIEIWALIKKLKND